MRYRRKAVEGFEAISAQYIEPAQGKLIDYTAPEPKHLFLDYLVKTKGLVLHGSNRLDLTVLTAHKAKGIHTDQALTAVYATTDSLMAIFFAIIDRQNVRKFSTRSTPYQFFIDEGSLVNKPWISGVVYILSQAQFEATASGNLVSYDDIAPIARLPVIASDFPYLDQIQGY